MGKLFSWIGSLMAMACLMEIASNPKQVVRDIQQGPAPHLALFDGGLAHPNRKSVRSTSHSVSRHDVKRLPDLR